MNTTLPADILNPPLVSHEGSEGLMSEPLPLTIAGRSPFDGIRLRWSGIGNLILAVACASGGNVAGIIFGVIFLILAIATWSITRLGTRPWYALSPGARALAGTGSVIGLVFLYLCFGIFFLTIWFIKVLAQMM
jgi:hypothetical protein